MMNVLAKHALYILANIQTSNTRKMSLVLVDSVCVLFLSEQTGLYGEDAVADLNEVRAVAVPDLMTRTGSLNNGSKPYFGGRVVSKPQFCCQSQEEGQVDVNDEEQSSHQQPQGHADSDSESDDEEGGHRERFKSERQNIITVTSGSRTSGKDIPETLGPVFSHASHPAGSSSTQV